MSVSVLFSVAIYQVASTEVRNRLDHFQTNFQESIEIEPPTGRVDIFRKIELSKANQNLSVELIYANLVVLIVGGLGSYFLACRSIRPIKRAHEAQSRFTSDASHELRTPLAVMKAEIEVALRDKEPTIEEWREVLSSNLEEIDKLTKLSEMLLNLSHLDHDKLKMGPVNLNKITSSVVRSFKQPPKRIAISGKRIRFVKADETAVIELIRILVENAILYSPKDTQILIKITKQNGYAKLIVNNQGKIIDEDKMPHIFDRFYRADSSRTSGEKKGFGLGLALAKDIVELHNGSIEVTSKPEDGTTFTLSLPISQKQSKN